ncbi:hypothetical protein [Pseudonocardia sp. DLS-67]
MLVNRDVPGLPGVVAAGSGYAFQPASDILRRGQYRLRRPKP